MRIEVEIAQLVANGADFEEIIDKARQQILPEYDRIVRARAAQSQLRLAKDRVAAGTYTSDDLVVLQKGLNEEKRKAAPQEKKVATAVEPRVVKTSEYKELMTSLGITCADNEGRAWR